MNTQPNTFLFATAAKKAGITSLDAVELGRAMAADWSSPLDAAQRAFVEAALDAHHAADSATRAA